MVLATLSVRVDPSAERMAIDSALEAGVPLVPVNILRFRPFPTTLLLVGPEGMNLPHEEDLDAATGHGGTRRRARREDRAAPGDHPPPVQALLEIVAERDAGLLVFGPDLRLTSRMRFRSLARKLRRNASCLLWIAPDG